MPPLTQADVLWFEFERIHGHAPDAVLSYDEMDAVALETRPEPPDEGPAHDERVERALRLARYYASVHALPAPGQSALCLSGGGVRSAAFCMGVIQGLARRGLLSQFHYLSTVSGGGYIGSWLTAWAHRRAMARPDDPARDPELTAFEEVEAEVARRPPHALHEVGPIAWLRRNQRYLTPRAGVLSGDLWAGAALFLRDLLLNWLVFLPAVMAVLLVPRLLQMQLVWWAGYADHAGSGFGYLVDAVRGRAMGPAPGWRGWTDIYSAGLAFLALAGLFHARLANSPMTDRRFFLAVMLPLVAAGWLATMFNAVVLAGGVVPDTVLLGLWMVGAPSTLVSARLAAGLLAGKAMDGRYVSPLRDLAWDLASLAVSGMVVGALIWGWLWVRSSAWWGQGTVRDLEVFGVPMLLVAFFGGQVVYTALACRAPFGRQDQEWMGRASGLYLMAGAIWAVTSGIVIYGDPLRRELLGLLAVIGVSGALTLSGAVSAISKANATLVAATQKAGVGVVIQGVALLFILSGTVLLTEIDKFPLQLARVFTGLAFEWRADRLVAMLVAQHLARQADGIDALVMAYPVTSMAAQAMGVIFVAMGLLLLTSVVLSMVVDVNLFSLHALYANRLVRTFLGASNLEGVTGRDPQRNTFDGFFQGDDVKLSEVWRWPEPPVSPERKGPYPVLNMALNLVSGPDPAWQDRKAAPFVATPYHVGGDLVGYMPHDDQFKRRHMTLGTAMAVSGAAASPNWGYHSSPLVGFLMTLFNVRLGWWFENPSRVSDMAFPLRSFRLFLQEALGQTRGSDPYLYLSDGGHFDNLGLYEMLRRRCRLVVAVDATQDPDVTLEDLGRTLRQVSIDLGVTVEFTTLPFRKRADPATAGLYAAIGTITYPENEKPGTLIYIKPGFLADAPADVRAFAAGDPKFPHDSTTNQWFTESQFESYRALGFHAASLLCGKVLSSDPGLELSDLPHLVERYIKRNQPPTAALLLPLPRGEGRGEGFWGRRRRRARPSPNPLPGGEGF